MRIIEEDDVLFLSLTLTLDTLPLSARLAMWTDLSD